MDLIPPDRNETKGEYFRRKGIDPYDEIDRLSAENSELKEIIREWMEAEAWEFRPSYDSLMAKSEEAITASTTQTPQGITGEYTAGGIDLTDPNPDKGR